MSVERVWIGDDEHYIPDASLWMKPGDKAEFESKEAVPDSPLLVTVAQAREHKARIDRWRELDAESAAAAEPEPAEPQDPEVSDDQQES